MSKQRNYLMQSPHLYSNFFAPRGNKRMLALGMQIAQQYLDPMDKLIGVIGDAGAGKSMLIKGMFPGLDLSNDDNGVNVRPLPILDVDEDDIDELESITTSLYDALVMHFKKNTIKFFTNYILANKDDLVEEYKGFIDNRDLSGITYKNTMINITVEDYVILVALPLIHKSLYDLTVDVDPIDFLDMSACSRLYSGGILKDYFETGKLCGSFVPSYMGILTGPMENYKQDILETVKRDLINRFKARSL